MLHFWPLAPIGQVESIPNVHFTEHTGCVIMSKLPVHTMLSHSLDVSLTVTHAAPNARGAGPPASGPEDGESAEHAARTSKQARNKRMRRRYPAIQDGNCDRGVTALDLPITGPVIA
jgi:hypothetical protein